MNLLKSVYNQLIHVKEFVKSEYQRERPTLGAILKNWPYGFHSNSHLIYDFENNKRSDYLSEWKRLKFASKINGRRDILVDDKFIFHKMNEESSNVLPVKFLILKNTIHQYDKGNLSECTLDDFYSALKLVTSGFIVKPFIEGGGAGITKITMKNGIITFSGHCKTEDQFIKIINNNTKYLITDTIKQTGYGYDIFPGSLNTIRILTMVDPDTQNPFIAAAIHRFGTKKSGFLDNWTEGGLSFSINIETGMMGKGASYPSNGKMNWYSAHPETKIEVQNIKIPNWTTIKTEILKIARHNFNIPYIGWDVVPMDGNFYVLEGNFNSGINILQIHGGLLKNENVKQFYRKHNVL